MNKSEIFEQIFSHNWPDEESLVKYAIDRNGFGGNDNYYGVTYPTDLDEYQREVEGEYIPEGYLEINYWDKQHKEIKCTESEYLAALKAHLINKGFTQLVKKLENA